MSNANSFNTHISKGSYRDFINSLVEQQDSSDKDIIATDTTSAAVIEQEPAETYIESEPIAIEQILTKEELEAQREVLVSLLIEIDQQIEKLKPQIEKAKKDLALVESEIKDILKTVNSRGRYEEGGFSKESKRDILLPFSKQLAKARYVLATLNVEFKPHADARIEVLAKLQITNNSLIAYIDRSNDIEQ